MKKKILNLCLIVFSLFGYLEWGKSNSTFLCKVEKEVLFKIFTNPSSVIHPFILLPLFGQLILFFTLFQKNPSKLLTIIGLFSLAILFVLMLFIGIISKNYKIILSTIPFLAIATLRILHLRNTNKS
jgi:hypothetical protein